MIKSILFLLLSANILLFSQNRVEFMPDGLNFLPLRANNQEAKIGVLYYPNSTNLKVDIGNSMDLLKINFNDPAEFITVGIEFMAYAHSMSYNQMRLQIGAVDGFFGGSAAYNKSYSNDKLKIRFRFIHNSAHLVDGFFNTTTGQWMDGLSPIPYTKDFAELVFAYEFNSAGIDFRPYIGSTYAVMIRPKTLERGTFLAGIESHYAAENKIFSSLPYNLFTAYHFNLSGIPEYMGSNHFQAGIKFGEWNKKGVNFYLSYFRGNNIFNEFYSERIERFGVGFTVDF